MEATPKIYCAIIGDIVHSKQLDAPARAEVQMLLRTVLEEVNERYKKSVAAKAIITLGDEFQILLSVPSLCAEIAQRIALAMHPVNLRFGIGIGEMLTEIDSSMALGADGPAYYRARSAIELLKKAGEPRRASAGFALRLLIFSGADDEILLDQVAQYLLHITSGWTKAQMRIVKAYVNSELGLSTPQAEIAETLSITQSVVSRTERAAHLKEYEKAVSGLKNHFYYKYDSQ
ncbi:MAG: SatD family protein [Clostridiales bacterium]|nr:SatD family protein [Clostridiales bacterium]